MCARGPSGSTATSVLSLHMCVDNVSASVRACVRACVRAVLRMCVRVCVRACGRAYVFVAAACEGEIGCLSMSSFAWCVCVCMYACVCARVCACCFGNGLYINALFRGVCLCVCVCVCVCVSAPEHPRVGRKE